MLPVLLSLALLQGHDSESVVTAPRAQETVTQTDALVTVISAEELAETGERSLPRAIEKAAGGSVWLQETNLGGGAPVIRGQVGNRILIVVDGVRVNDSTTRLGPNQSLNGFESNEIERVEILRGPGSVLWGSDAIGGVVLIWTKKAGFLKDESARVEFDSGLSTRVNSAYDGGTLGGDVAVRTPDWGLYAAGNWFSFGDLESAAGTVDHTGYHGRSYFTSFEQDLGDERSLRLTGSVHKDLGVPRTDKMIVGYGQTVPSEDKWYYTLQDRRRFIAALTDENDYGFAERTQIRASYRTYVEERERLATGSTSQRFYRDEVETLGLGVDFQKAVGDHFLTYGLDLEEDEVDSVRNDLDLVTMIWTPNDGAFAPNADYQRFGVFVQDETAVGDFDATIGARYSRYEFGFDPFGGGARESGDFDAVTFSAQVGRQVNDTTRVTATLAQGFRAPNLDDLANTGSFAGGTEVGNPDLEPEEALSYDLAVEWADDGWGATAAVFYTDIDDVLGRVLTDPGDPLVSGDETYLRENVGRLELFGAEAALRHPIGAETGTRFYGSYGLTWTKGIHHDDLIDPVDGESDARRIPPLFGRAALEVRPDEAMWGTDWLDVELRFADDQGDLHPQDISDPRINPNGTPGWGVVNVDFGGQASESLTWNAGVHNVFDKEYRVHSSGFDAPGIALVFGMEWRP